MNCHKKVAFLSLWVIRYRTFLPYRRYRYHRYCFSNFKSYLYLMSANDWGHPEPKMVRNSRVELVTGLNNNHTLNPLVPKVGR